MEGGLDIENSVLSDIRTYYTKEINYLVLVVRTMVTSGKGSQHGPCLGPAIPLPLSDQ